MKTIYFAGPQVFLPIPEVFFDKVRECCAEHGFIPLIPDNPELTTPQEIFEFNKSLLESADIVVANIAAFRGPDMDCGTAWEIGFAHALKKPILLYTGDGVQTVYQKTKAFFGTPVTLPMAPSIEILPDDMTVENFGLTTNLMIAMTGHGALYGDVFSAVRHCKEIFDI